MDDVVKGEYSMTCVFLGDEGCNCANQECAKHWGDDRGAKVCPHCGHTEQMWWASWVEKMRQWQASGQKGYFVYNASVKLGPGQRTEKQYLDDKGWEYEEVSMEQFHLIRRPDRRHSVVPIQHTTQHSAQHTDVYPMAMQQNPMSTKGGSLSRAVKAEALQMQQNPMQQSQVL
jgi:hypothetical protein